jgi:Ala-tRNA(Pro) deacylase
MTVIAERVRELLDANDVEYEVIHHRRDYTASQAAADTHTPGRHFAKAVIVHVAGGAAMAVLPSHHVVDAERLSFALGGKEVRLASEEEIDGLIPDCEGGAVPPFGNLYGMPVYVSPELAKSETITCVAGSHADAIRLSWRDYERLVRPHVLDFSVVQRPREAHGS